MFLEVETFDKGNVKGEHWSSSPQEIWGLCTIPKMRDFSQWDPNQLTKAQLARLFPVAS